MTRPWRRRRPHVLERIPSSRGDAECGQIPEVNTFVGSSSKNVHNVVDKSRSVPFTRCWDEADAIQLSPGVCTRVIRPDIIEPLQAIRSSKPGAGSEIERMNQRAKRV